MTAQERRPGPKAIRQLGLLLGLWWRHVRRRPMRLGDAPKQSGVPTFLLFNLLSLAYSLPLVFRGVAQDVEHHPSFLAWHLLGSGALALGNGISKGAATLQLRGGRSDEFLAALPLSLQARLGLQLADGYFMWLIALVVAAAGAATTGLVGLSLDLSILLGASAYVGAFVVGQALIAWVRALGPPSAARIGGYTGVGLVMLGFGLTFLPVSSVMEPGPITDRLMRWWLGDRQEMLVLLATTLGLAGAGYGALSAAERRGFDHLDPHVRVPRATTGSRSRTALEARMIWRQGARVQLPMLTLLVAGVGGFMVLRVPEREVTSAALIFGSLATYAGALQVINHAGIAVRRDLKARAFLAALPLSPYEVLEGKAGALRKLTVPMLSLLVFVAGLALIYGDPGLSYRALLAALALYVAVDGAVSIAFMSTGVGVPGVGGGQSSSGLSTQLLLLPLLAILVSNDGWSATVACLTVFVLTHQAQRAARRSVRWLDDPDDAVERETSVWRALLAATVFFTSQIFVGRVLTLFKVAPGYSLAAAFFVSALVLSLLTWRDSARFTPPAFRPLQSWYWPLGAVGGAATAMLSIWLIEKIVPSSAAAPQLLTRAESMAMTAVAVLLAPLAEEYFFRGWLQRAIERDLPKPWKRWAFAFGALAFALAHVGSYGVPQLLLGLVAGALYARGGGLGPAMLAHAVHNGVATWAAAR